MRVDIVGNYEIPALKLKAPVSGVELNINQLRILLNYKNLIVLVADTSVTIDGRNLEMVYNKYNGKQKTPVVKKKETPVVVPKKIEVIETVPETVKFEPLPEITKEVVTEERVCEPVTDTEPIVETDIIDLDVYNEPEILVEEKKETDSTSSITDDASKFRNNKKRNKKRNRNHDGQ